MTAAQLRLTAGPPKLCAPETSTNSRSAGCGRGQQFAGRPAGHDAPVEQHADAVADAEGGGHVVGDDHRGHAEVVGGPADHVVDVLGGDGVEAGGRFIVEQNLRPVDQRPRQAHPLAHAARQLGRELLLDVGDVGQVQPVQQIAHPLQHLFPRQLVPLQQRERRCSPPPSSNRTGRRTGTPCRTCAAARPARPRSCRRCPRRRPGCGPSRAASAPSGASSAPICPAPSRR